MYFLRYNFFSSCLVEVLRSDSVRKLRMDSEVHLKFSKLYCFALVHYDNIVEILLADTQPLKFSKVG